MGIIRRQTSFEGFLDGHLCFIFQACLPSRGLGIIALCEFPIGRILIFIGLTVITMSDLRSPYVKLMLVRYFKLFWCLNYAARYKDPAPILNEVFGNSVNWELFKNRPLLNIFGTDWTICIGLGSKALQKVLARGAAYESCDNLFPNTDQRRVVTADTRPKLQYSTEGFGLIKPRTSVSDGS